MRRSVILSMCLAWLSSQLVQADDPPKSLDPRLKIELFAEHPQIVTPTGLDVDHRGRVFAIENNTHFPPEGYKGHPSDRVLLMSDSDNDGKADKIVVFTDGLKFSMSVVVRPIWFGEGRGTRGEGRADKSSKPSSPLAPQPSSLSLYIATRSEIFQFHDDDGDDKADRKESIVRLDTKGDYPHNGLAGFAIDALGWMYFGFGENLGADYKIIGSDGTTLSGGGEGGNIYRCRLDGSKLSQIATGFWNPHASCFDAFGRLFTVDNDADSRPPCRLLHVIPGGDYGYRFRNGRKGLHPFTAWNGEIPGTLPMVAGTGEAPSGILAYESDGLPEEYLGNLLVTSWGDHRIDRFRLQPKGTSFTSLAEPLITGGENFRPVGLATAPDGSLFCTDWVLRDYKLHGHGRIWRIVPKKARQTEVIDIASIPKMETTRQIEFLESPRREIRRMAARQFLSGGARTPRARTELRWSRLLSHEKPLLADDPLLDFGNSIPNLAAAYERISAADQQRVVDVDAKRLLLDLLAEQKGPRKYDHDLLLPMIASVKLDAEFIRLACSVDDPFILGMLVTVLAKQFTQDDFSKYLITDATPSVKASAPRVRQAMLLAARKQAPQEDRLLRVALSDHDPDVRRLAVQWVAEEKLTDLKPRVAAMFDSQGMTTELFLATIAALEMLDGKKPEDFDKTPAEQYVVPLLKDEQRSPAVRAQALRLVSPTDKSLDASFFASLLKSDQEALRLETVRTLQGAKSEIAGPLLRDVADASRVGVNHADKRTRDASTTLLTEAMLGLASIAKSEPVGGPTRKLLLTFVVPPLGGERTKKEEPPQGGTTNLLGEALRASRGLIGDDAELRAAVVAVAKSLKGLDQDLATELADQIALAFTEAKLDPPQELKLNTSPKPATRQEWMDQLVRGGNVDPAAGRRVFFHPNGPGCFKCHIVDGRGGRVGPDLSRAVGNMNRIQLIQSILEPSREIAPQFVSWTFELKDGKVVTGMVVHENEGKTIVGNAEGQLIEIKTANIETRTPQKISVMPEKLSERMTLQELRDLLAFLESQR